MLNYLPQIPWVTFRAILYTKFNIHLERLKLIAVNPIMCLISCFTLSVVPILLKTASMAPSSSRWENTLLPLMAIAQLAISKCFPSKSAFSGPKCFLHSCRSNSFISSSVIRLRLMFLSRSLPVGIHSNFWRIIARKTTKRAITTLKPLFIFPRWKVWFSVETKLTR